MKVGEFGVFVGWGQAIPETVQNMDGNTFEFVIDSNNADAMNGFIQFNPFSLGDDSENMALILSKDVNDVKLTLTTQKLFTWELEAGDIIAAQIRDNGSSPSEVIWILKIAGGDVMIFDPIPYNLAAQDVVMSVINIATSQAGGDFGITFNGIEADYIIDEYPVGSLDFKGDSMASKISAHTRNAKWTDNGWNSQKELVGNTVSLDATGKVLTCSSAPSATFVEMRSYCTSMVDNNSGDTIVVMMEVTTNDSNGHSAHLRLGNMEADVVSTRYIDIWNDFSGGNIIGRINTADTFTTHTILAGDFVAGDVVAIEMKTSTNEVKFHHYRTSTTTLTSTAFVSYDGSGGEAIAKYIPSGGVATLGAGDTAVLTNLNEASDMIAPIKAALSAGAVDILGVTI